MSSNRSAIELRGVSKTFGALQAVDDLELVIPRKPWLAEPAAEPATWMFGKPPDLKTLIKWVRAA